MLLPLPGRAVEQPLGGALDRDLEAGIPGLEGLGHRLGDGKVHRRVVGDLAFLLRGLDQRRRDRLGRRRGRDDAGAEGKERRGHE
jgi:hypothetical protein